MLEHFKTPFPLTQAQKQKYASYFTQVKVPAKTILLSEGDISKKLYWIEKGCIRVWFNNNGKEVTYQFFVEGSAVASIESFRKNIPSPITIETIEACILWVAHKKDIEKIISEINEIPKLRDLFIEHIFERTFDYMKHFFSHIKNTPLQRYENLLKEKPEIVQRVPQHYIASYLGITKVHLSRLKGKFAKK